MKTRVRNHASETTLRILQLLRIKSLREIIIIIIISFTFSAPCIITHIREKD